MENKYYVSVIIPALNEERNIGQCLESLTKLDISRDKFEVIVVDNGSVDNTCKIAEIFSDQLNLTILKIPKITISALRNRGTNYSQGNILAFLDADCTVCKDWIKNALKHFNNPIISAVGASYCIPEDSSWVAKTWSLILEKKRKVGFTSTLPAGNLFVRKENFLSINGFNEKLITNEDYDFCFRLIKKGGKIYSDTDIIVIHKGVPNNLFHFFKKEKWRGTHVFKVFIDNIIDLRNIKPVFYALYYIMFILLIITNIGLILLYNKYYYVLMLNLFLIFIPSILLSFKIIKFKDKSYKYFFKLCVIYFTYGLARAVSILNFKNWL